MLLGLIFLSFAVCYIYTKLGQRRFEKCTENIPGDKALPIIGNALVLMNIKNPAELWTRVKTLTSKFNQKKILKFWFGPLLGVMVWEPSYLEKLARVDMTNKSEAYTMVLGHIANGVLVDGGKKWRELRRPIARSMANKLLQIDYFKVFASRSRDLGRFIDDTLVGQCSDVAHLFGCLFLGIFCETHIGVHVDEVRENKWKFIKHIDEVLHMTIVAICNYYFHFWKIALKFTGESKKLHHHMNEVSNFLTWVLDERRNTKSTAEGKEYYTDFLLKRMSEKNFSENDIKKELIDFIVAGSDTSSVVTSSIVVYLAMHPEVQEKAYLEQEAIFRGSERDPTPEDVADMEYLNMVVKEALRKVCPPGIVRCCPTDVDLGEYTIPKGCYIYLHLAGLHSDPDYWERPNDFYPEHFLPEKEAARPHYSYLPFGIGARACPGSRYGVLSIKTVLSSLLRRFKFSTPLKYEDIVYESGLLLKMFSGYKVKFERRS